MPSSTSKKVFSFREVVGGPDSLINQSAASKLYSLLSDLHQDEIESEKTLHLTAYENRLSKLAESFLSTPLGYRQHEGTAHSRSGDSEVVINPAFVFKGLPNLYRLESAATNAACKMFSASMADFRPTSGLHAMLCTLLSLTEPGDLIYSIDPSDGGHFATRHLLQRSGRKSLFLPWDIKSSNIDLYKFASEVKTFQPKALFFEQGVPLFPLPLEDIRAIVGEETLIIYDASHTLGLIAGGCYQDPLNEGCDILQGNTHKTFPGPQKGMILFRSYELGEMVSNSIGAGLVSNQHAHHAIAEYITVLEMEHFGQSYAKQCLKNAQSLAKALTSHGIKLYQYNGQFTNSHLLLLLFNQAEEHVEVCKKLHHASISTNARIALRKGVIRIGVQELTRRGMKESEMYQIADFFKRIIIEGESPTNVRNDVIVFNSHFSQISYSFDSISELSEFQPTTKRRFSS